MLKIGPLAYDAVSFVSSLFRSESQDPDTSTHEMLSGNTEHPFFYFQFGIYGRYFANFIIKCYLYHTNSEWRKPETCHVEL